VEFVKVFAVALVAVAMVSLAGCEDSEMQELSARVSDLENAYQSMRTELDTPPPAGPAAVVPAPAVATPTPIPTPTVTPVPEATATPTPRPTLTPTPGETAGGVVATIDAEDGLNARTEPNTDSAVLEVIAHETEVELTGASQVIDDIEWVELTRGGWVQSQYLVYP
jgi:hypothetical protein